MFRSLSRVERGASAKRWLRTPPFTFTPSSSTRNPLVRPLLPPEQKRNLVNIRHIIPLTNSKKQTLWTPSRARWTFSSPYPSSNLKATTPLCTPPLVRSNNQPTDEFTTAEGFGGRWVDVLPSVESEMTPWIVGVWDDFEALASYIFSQCIMPVPDFFYAL
ncbi:uncharacterized protein LACBIDRAFT_330323 [Laccaria bicolor S238N-H82]|uniref:Predicted protein n=1 Tax=Laccaria bicolor (strain S238N-H82 / ATCC MYA-4686) TaxID=486041 RepID=B0DKX6_LACBS|nr:uncharacterized protein LACBIDRAFT_330323 [Laccaria bicolor S238N-H82]EDR04816.1 predicted protein [Laccaria bicolor S238N-H82]|eukprot:XP_001884640.1 predicted protein [Laccaria bicolor S238N-H82]